MTSGPLEFALRSFGSALQALRQPGPVLVQLYQMLIGALLLGMVAGVALGAVVWMHLHSALERTGTQEALPTFLSVAVLLELAPIGAGLILASRTGAALGAELGAMKQSEQLDALSMLGVSPMRVLVGPRVLACILALPLLNYLIAVLAISSGYLADLFVSNTSWTRYLSLCLERLELGEVIPAGLKTFVFGYLVGVAGCYHGFTATGGTEGVGRAATSGVVGSALAVMIADVVIVALIQAMK
jgi:phospholipid/cholesterol/gamma-HCH transport system permease protein